MEMYLWDSYKPEDITPQMKHWADYWKESIEKFPDPVLGLRLDSPRLLFGDVMDEVEFNNLRNEKIKTYFSKKAKEWVQLGKIIGTEAIGHVQLLQAALKSEPHGYVFAICKQGLNYLNSGKFFGHVHSQLVTRLLAKEVDDDDYQAIERASDLLILEFTANGYSPKTCAKFPANIFAGYCVLQDDLVTTNFPHLCKSKDFQKNGETDYKAFFESVIKEIESLTVEKRLLALERYFNRPMEDYKFIFPLWGIRGDNEVTIGNVTIYSPQRKQYGQNPIGGRNPELFGQKDSYIFSNAIVQIKSRDFEDTKDKALMEIETALDLVGFFRSADDVIKAQRYWHVILNSDGSYAGESMANSREDGNTFWAWHESVNLDDAMGDAGEKLFKKACESLVHSQGKTYFEKQVSTALHWFRKGKEERHNEDKLLNFWIVLEKMFVDPHYSGGLVQDKINSILDLVPSIYTERMFYNVGWNLFYYLRALLGSSQGGRKLLELPVDLVRAAKLEHVQGQTVHIKDFVDNLSKIHGHVERRIVRQKIEHAINYFSKNKYAADFLEQTLADVRTDLLLVYRYRNKVVHDAHYNDRMLPYYVRKVERYAGHFLSYMVSKVGETNKSVLELAIEEKANVASIIKKLRLNPSYRLDGLE